MLLIFSGIRLAQIPRNFGVFFGINSHVAQPPCMAIENILIFLCIIVLYIMGNMGKEMACSLFKEIFKGKVVIVGIGNIMRQDDGFGPKLIENLKGKIQAVCIDAGTTPENYIGKVTKEEPNTILIVDAVHLGKIAGEYEILEKKDILKSGLATHDISPAMYIEFLEKETNADIYMLGVQSKSIDFGEEMTEAVKKSLEQIANKIIKCAG